MGRGVGRLRRRLRPPDEVAHSKTSSLQWKARSQNTPGRNDLQIGGHRYAEGWSSQHALNISDDRPAADAPPRPANPRQTVSCCRTRPPESAASRRRLVEDGPAAVTAPSALSRSHATAGQRIAMLGLVLTRRADESKPAKFVSYKELRGTSGAILQNYSCKTWAGERFATAHDYRWGSSVTSTTD
jgi:hypothetical protein